MAQIKPRVKLPRTIAAGEVFTVKTLINHNMESGRRMAKDGSKIPRRIINRFEATFNGEPVFTMELEPAISANPYIEFEMKVDGAGELSLKWLDDDGSVYQSSDEIAIG